MLDSKDNIILDLLQKNGRMTAKDIAERVELSVPAVAERIKKLVEEKIIREFRAIVDSKKLGYDVTAFILLVMASSERYEAMINHVKKSDEILECHSITGEGSHMLKVRIKNTSSLEILLRKIQSWEDVIRTQTMIVMSTFKEETFLLLRKKKQL
ncbi:MAG: Lrp/AsnC family transcriptional regulator [Candidatus Marinimicrobia bacterium]|nr:Lrp/AsnC family transcriptional regulator [Candidatus Neomarinimicrobiota bacterium]